MSNPKYRKKLIEVALPLEAINRESAREKSIRHGHPSTLHLWWARRPLAACRAVLFAQLVDDPSAHPDKFPTEEDQKRERDRLFKIIEALVKWENINNEKVLQAARAEILKSTDGNPPSVLDPFCGGGSIPLEAQRLGLKAYASDLNPVAVLITKALIEIPPKFAGMPPVNPKSRMEFLGTRTFRVQEWEVPGTRASRPHKEWHSRGYLPHFDHPGLIQSITFRLFDSIPADILRGWKQELEIKDEIASDHPSAVELRKRVEAYEDAGHGACFLKDERIAKLVEDALLHFDGERYRLMVWCIMPNHVHVLIETIQGNRLSDIVHSWKSFTAKKANERLGRAGRFWMNEYFDRFIRDEAHLNAVKEYIETNPVKAGLCDRPEEWPFSSAGDETEIDAGETPALPGFWQGAKGLAEDVRYYGKWMRDEAEKRIGHLYPKVKLPKEQGGGEATVIAWLWARTVKCPNPACGAQMPLVRSFALSTKKGKQAWVEPVVAGNQYHFEVCTGHGKPREGTVNRTGARCLCCDTPVPFNHVRTEGKAGRMGQRLMAIVAEGSRGRIYLAPNEEHVNIANSVKPSWRPDAKLQGKVAVNVPLYGLKTFGDLFSPRQLVALTTFSDLVIAARERVLEVAIKAGMRNDKKGVDDGGMGAMAYADAIATYLAFAVDKLADRNSTICTWAPNREHARNTFTRQALPMTWDFAESNPFCFSSGNYQGGIETIDLVLKNLVHVKGGVVKQFDTSQHIESSVQLLISTDPPYYDNIGYADLSDFFYLWLRRSLGRIYPGLFSTMLVPKAEELVATPYRFDGDRKKASEFFETGLRKAFERMKAVSHLKCPMAIYYAFKQAEDDSRIQDGNGNHALTSTGWETMLEGLLQTGFQITGTWPMRTELITNLKKKVSALASSIVLACRHRPDDAPMTTRRDFINALKQELPKALKTLQQGNIAPVDLAQSAIGPGIAVFSRFTKVLEADASPMRVRSALALINQVLDEYLTEQEGEYDPDTRWALAWFEQHGVDEGPYGVAETLSKAKNTAVDALAKAGILVSKAGKVRLLRREELPDDWDPTKDKRLTVWEVTQQLIKALVDKGSEEVAADLLKKVGGLGETARDLAYRLYTICDRKKWSQEALAYNSLVVAWPELVKLAGRGESKKPTQTEMFTP